ncbi:hypothetical protein ABFX02_13G097250 [Erythranthe guttata]
MAKHERLSISSLYLRLHVLTATCNSFATSSIFTCTTFNLATNTKTAATTGMGCLPVVTNHSIKHCNKNTP